MPSAETAVSPRASSSPEATSAAWVLPGDPEGLPPQAAREAAESYREPPYPPLNGEFVGRYRRPGARQALDTLREDPPANLDEPTRDLEQIHLDSLVADYEARASGSLLRRLALVPSRVLLQPGWLTRRSLSFGWMHLLGDT